MSTILYNANSTLVSRFQRKVKLRNELNQDYNDETSFESQYAKDSPEYLQELCKSVYPACLHASFERMPFSTLSVHAFVALVFKNFIKSWFGPKIPSEDPEFLCEVFALVQRLITHIESHEVHWEQFILDDVPLVVFEHYQLLKTSGLVYSRKTGPSTTANYICSLLHSDSTLEHTFVKSLYEHLLCGKILHSIAEPYLILEILNKAIQFKLQKSGSKSSSLVGKVCAILGVVRSALNSQLRRPSQLQQTFAHRFLFSCLRRLTKFEQRRPLLYCLFKYGEAAAAKVPAIDKILYCLFQKCVHDKIASGPQIGRLFLSLRRLIFPSDTVMGPPRPILDDHQKKLLREECEQNIQQFLLLYKLDGLVGLTATDASNFVDVVIADHDANANLLERLLTCTIAHIA
ncbi:LAFA_0G08394g1_1 [Lachancea sp. 'fantastica']|nr:LAFA_0G08394g1_1 [Lachancea sp. 'fantastica']